MLRNELFVISFKSSVLRFYHFYLIAYDISWKYKFFSEVFKYHMIIGPKTEIKAENWVIYSSLTSQLIR